MFDQIENAIRENDLSNKKELLEALLLLHQGFCDALKLNVPLAKLINIAEIDPRFEALTKLEVVDTATENLHNKIYFSQLTHLNRFYKNSQSLYTKEKLKKHFRGSI